MQTSDLDERTYQLFPFSPSETSSSHLCELETSMPSPISSRKQELQSSVRVHDKRSEKKSPEHDTCEEKTTKNQVSVIQQQTNQTQ